MQVRHQLQDTDFPRRVRYAKWLNQKNVRFMGNVVIGDEAAFFMNGKVNSHNARCKNEKMFIFKHTGVFT